MVLGRLSWLAALGIAACSGYAAQSGNQDWPVAGGAGQVRYSTLDQINTRNVQNLKKAWQWDSGDEFPGSEMQCNPIVIDGVMYATTPSVRVVALDGATGKMIWDFDAHRGENEERQATEPGARVLGAMATTGVSSWASITGSMR